MSLRVGVGRGYVSQTKAMKDVGTNLELLVPDGTTKVKMEPTCGDPGHWGTLHHGYSQP